ncbi:MAG: glycoside hydrolase family 15 protein [Dehalococcoidia bacterium]
MVEGDSGVTPIEAYGVIGDRRTAALVSACGRVDWLALPDFDGRTVFGRLLDPRGGSWRFGPHAESPGSQHYEPETCVLTTRWETAEGTLELTDFMAWPESSRPEGMADVRLVVRRLQSTAGRHVCALELSPVYVFRERLAGLGGEGSPLAVDGTALRFWTTVLRSSWKARQRIDFELAEGEEQWAVLSCGSSDAVDPLLNAEGLTGLLESTRSYWRGRARRVRYEGPARELVVRSLLTIHLLSYAPAGSVVAAPTTSLPERLGGDRNYDYRFAWVRDASLSLAVVAMLGDTEAARDYMDWLVACPPGAEGPLQVVYGIRGEVDLTEVIRDDIRGYEDSRPVREGNAAYDQRQLDSLGYLADCALRYLESRGEWRASFWDLIRRAADYVVATWREPDSGIWEIRGDQRHYVSSKVMSWVTLERAIRIAMSLGEPVAPAWNAARDEIHAEVCRRGWSPVLGAFRQHYDADTLDSSALLIPVMGFLPATDPRVVSTVERLRADLEINGHLHRFDARVLAGEVPLAPGDFEGAFVPCTLWLITTLALMGRGTEAERLLTSLEGQLPLGLLPEEIDARSGRFLGNTPLMFAHVEYLRARLQLAGSVDMDEGG